MLAHLNNNKKLEHRYLFRLAGLNLIFFENEIEFEEVFLSSRKHEYRVEHIKKVRGMIFYHGVFS